MKNTISNAWKNWRKISQKAMEIQAKVLLGIIYFTILVPVGLWYRATHDILKNKPVTTNWQDWPHTNTDKEIKEM